MRRNVSAQIEQVAGAGDLLTPRMRLKFDMQQTAFTMARDAFNDERPALADRLAIVCIIADPVYRNEPDKGAALIRRVAEANQSNRAYREHLEPYANALDQYWMERELAPSDEAHDRMWARGDDGSASADTDGRAERPACTSESPSTVQPSLTSDPKHEGRF